ncbi:MAG: TonB-dependent receptor [Gammaproteobacteria bacterium]
MATQSPFLRKALFTSLAAALLAPYAQAQQASDSSDIEEMVVTATRSEKPLSQIPNTVTVIGAQDLLQQIGVNNDLSTILGNLIPSFSPSRQKMTGAGESLRGRDPLYMVDGVPQSNPLRDGSRDGHTIDPLMLERIEVIHGANAIHGMGASGGIINMITRRPAEQWQQSVRLEGVGQSEDVSESLGYGASYTLSGRTGNVDFLGSASYRTSGISYDADGEVIGFDNAQGDTMDSETLNLFLKTGYEWGDQRLELTVNDYDVSGNNDWLAVAGDYANGVPTTAVEANVVGAAVSNEVTMFSLSYTKADLFGHSVRLQAFDQDFAGTYGGDIYATFADPAFGGDIFDQSQNNSTKRGLKLTLAKDNIAGTPFSAVYGADLLNDETNQSLVATGRAWVPTTNYENLALFAQFEFTGIEDLTLTAGVRREDSALDVDDFTTLYSYNGGQFVRGGNPEFSDTLSNIGATYQITPQWRVFANLSEGFSMPDVGRVLRGINIPDQDVETFLNLEPIVTENTELGFEFDNDVFSAQLSYFASEADFGQRLQANADGIYGVMRERTEIDGYEFRAQWNASMSDVLGLRYANTEGEYDSDGDNRVDTDLGGSNMSPNRVNLSWERTWSSQFNTRVQVNVVQDREFKNAVGVETAQFDGYTTIDLFAEYEASVGQLRLGLQNLSNEDYFTYYSQTQGSDTRNFKGIGRSVSLSWNLQF